MKIEVNIDSIATIMITMLCDQINAFVRALFGTKKDLNESDREEIDLNDPEFTNLYIIDGVIVELNLPHDANVEGDVMPVLPLV